MTKLKTIGFIVGAGVAAIAALALSQASFISPAAAESTSKVCSAHGGVNCLAGAAYDGSVVCADGTRDGSVTYSSQSVCKTPALHCPIYLPKDEYDKEKTAVAAASDALTTGHKKICNDDFSAMETLNKQMDASCVAAATTTSDKDLCAKNKISTAAYDKSNLNLCLHSTDDMAAKYKAMIACLKTPTDKNATGYGALGYLLPNLHPAFAGKCDAYGSAAALNNADALCECPDGWSWNSSGKACAQNPPCAAGSSWSKGACVTNTKICMNKYGGSAYSTATATGGHECHCGDGYKWNSAKTACVAK
jgi:hypothetical protein